MKYIAKKILVRMKNTYTDQLDSFKNLWYTIKFSNKKKTGKRQMITQRKN